VYRESGRGRYKRQGRQDAKAAKKKSEEFDPQIAQISQIGRAAQEGSAAGLICVHLRDLRIISPLFSHLGGLGALAHLAF
jgi:hypothetical protein